MEDILFSRGRHFYLVWTPRPAIATDDEAVIHFIREGPGAWLSYCYVVGIYGRARWPGEPPPRPTYLDELTSS